MALTELMKPMRQLSLAETCFLPKAGNQTRKAMFLAEMDTVVPWSRLEGLIEPFYPKKGYGRPPMPLGTTSPARHDLKRYSMEKIAIPAK